MNAALPGARHRRPVVGGEDAVDVAHADLGGEVHRVGGVVGHEQDLGAELLLHEVPDGLVAVLALGAVDHQVGLGGDDPGDDRAEVGLLRRVGLGQHRLDAGRLQLSAGRLPPPGRRTGCRRLSRRRSSAAGRRAATRCSRRRTGRGRGPGTPGRGTGCAGGARTRSGAAGRLDERVAVPGRHARRGNGQQAGDRAEHQVNVVLGDQGLVVGDHLGGAGGVVDDLELDLAAEDAARLVDLVGPELVALLRGLAGVAEVAGQREGDADHQWRLVPAAAAAPPAPVAPRPVRRSTSRRPRPPPAPRPRSPRSALPEECVCASVPPT